MLSATFERLNCYSARVLHLLFLLCFHWLFRSGFLNQPGVEAYKKNMFALLEKPGYEAATQAIKARL